MRLPLSERVLLRRCATGPSDGPWSARPSARYAAASSGSVAAALDANETDQNEMSAVAELMESLRAPR